MHVRTSTFVTLAALLAAPSGAQAAMSTYSQNFEGLAMSDPAALSADGWLVFGNVFSIDRGTYFYGYGPFPAPNPGGGFCAIDAGQGGPEQGAQQLSVYSDYNNTDHGAGRLIEANVFREQTVGAADVGGVWTFQFDAKLGNLVAPSTALAFIKTLDPANGFALTNFITADMSAIPGTWNTYTLEIPIVAGLVGQLVQIGFANDATNYESSGVYYDNIVWSRTSSVGLPPATVAGGVELAAPSPNPVRGSARFGFTLADAGPVDLGVFDVTGRRVATLFRGHAEAGAQAVTWSGRAADGALVRPGVYACVLEAAGTRRTRTLVLFR